MWCPVSFLVNGKEIQYPLPEPYLPLNFVNSTGMRYEAEEVRQCLLKGTKCKSASVSASLQEGIKSIGKTNQELRDAVMHTLNTRWREKHS